MSYTPHEWQNDELITAAKMNNIEEGIAEGGGGGVGIDVVFYETDGVWQSKGLSFADANEKMMNGEPLIALFFNLFSASQSGFGCFQQITRLSDRIEFYFTSSLAPRVVWNASGVTYDD